MPVKKILKNNILLITEKSENTKTVSVGFWFRVGSRNEDKNHRGISHLTEHMIFKGTDTHTTKDIAVTFDKTGGFANAFTEKENVCMHFTVPAINDNLKKAMSVFCDMAQNACFPAEEFEREKDVVKKEIISVREDPEEAALDEVAQFVWKDEGLRKNISGTEEEVDSLTREDVIDWYNKYFINGELTVCAAGCFDEKEIINELEKLSVKKLNSTKKQPLSEFQKNNLIKNFWNKGVFIKKSEFFQEQFFMLYPFETVLTEKEYWSLIIFNALSGDTMSSRLFENLREKTGYCYSVYSYFTIYENESVWCAYASSAKKNAVQITQILCEQALSLLKESIPEEEVNIARRHVIGEEIISSEDMDYVMKRLYRNHEMHFPLNSTDDTIKMIESITMENVINSINRLINNENRAFVMYGPSLNRSSVKTIKELLK